MRGGGASGAEVVISGCIKGQRAKSSKYKAGVRVSTGQPVIDYVQYANRHVLMRKGIIGVRIKIMLPHGEAQKEQQTVVGRPGTVFEPMRPLPDYVKILPPKNID